MCPQVDKLEREFGNTRRHVVYLSALNDSAHHGDAPFNRIHITRPRMVLQLISLRFKSRFPARKLACNADGRSNLCKPATLQSRLKDYRSQPKEDMMLLSEVLPERTKRIGGHSYI